MFRYIQVINRICRYRRWLVLYVTTCWVITTHLNQKLFKFEFSPKKSDPRKGLTGYSQALNVNNFMSMDDTIKIEVPFKSA